MGLNTPVPSHGTRVFPSAELGKGPAAMSNEANAEQVGLKLALSRVEAAQALGVSPVTVDRLALRGLLRPSRATRRPLYSVDEIRRFLAETTGSMERGIA